MIEKLLEVVPKILKTNPSSKSLIALLLVLVVSGIIYIATISFDNHLRDNNLLYVVLIRLVALAVLLLISYMFYRWIINQPKSMLEEPSDKRTRIAVLPLNANPTSSQFTRAGSGISDEVIRALKLAPKLEVIEERSIQALPKDKTSPQEIAQCLDGLDYVLQGKLESNGTDCAIKARLLNVATGELKTFISDRRPWNHIGNFPASIATGILETFGVPCDSGENSDGVQISILDVDTAFLKAYEKFQDGKYNLKEYNIGHKQENYDAANQLLKKAISFYGDFAEAHASLGFLKAIAWEVKGDANLLGDAETHFRDCLSIDKNHAVAKAELAYLDFLKGNIEIAIEQARETIHHTSTMAIPYNVLSLLYLFSGFWEESIHLTAKVNRLDPLYTYPYTNASLASQLLGFHKDAIRWVDRALEKVPGAVIPFLYLGSAYFRSGDFEKAQASWTEGKQRAEQSDKFLFDAVLTWIPSTQGNKQQAIDLIKNPEFNKWVKGGYSTFMLSTLTLAGELESAINLLKHNHTYASNYRYLISDKTLKPLYSHPDFEILLHRRYSEWSNHLAKFNSGLEKASPRIKDPDHFLASIKSKKSAHLYDPV